MKLGSVHDISRISLVYLKLEYICLNHRIEMLFKIFHFIVECSLRIKWIINKI